MKKFFVFFLLLFSVGCSRPPEPLPSANGKQTIERKITYSNTIPDVIATGLLASVITLLGVGYTARINYKGLRIQQEESAEKDKLERRYQLRKELYLATIDELVKCNNYILYMSMSDGSEEWFGNETDGLTTMIQKIQLVSEPQTLEIGKRVAGSYLAIARELRENVMPLIELNIESNTAKKYMDQYTKERHDATSEMRALDESNPSNSERIKELIRRVDLSNESVRILRERLDGRKEERERRSATFIEYFNRKVQPVLNQREAFINAMRAELELKDVSLPN